MKKFVIKVYSFLAGEQDISVCGEQEKDKAVQRFVFCGITIISVTEVEA